MIWVNALVALASGVYWKEFLDRRTAFDRVAGRPVAARMAAASPTESE